MRAIAILKTCLSLCLFVAICPQAPAQRLDDGTYFIKSRCWLKAEGDGQTVGLFHLESANASATTALDELSMDDLLNAPSMLEGAKSGPGDLVDSSLIPQAGESKGLVPEPKGRLGEALRFPADTGGYIRSPAYPKLGGKGWEATAEGWFYLEEPAAAKAGTEAAAAIPLIVYAMQSGRQLSLFRQADGSAQIRWRDRVLAETPPGRVRTNQWQHIAFSVDVTDTFWDNANNRSTPTAAGMRLFVNGELCLSLASKEGIRGRESVPAIRELWGEERARVWFGSRPDGDTHMVGVIDELQISSAPRDYYPWHPPTVIEANPRSDVRPYLRDSRDLKLHLDFDTAQRAN